MSWEFEDKEKEDAINNSVRGFTDFQRKLMEIDLDNDPEANARAEEEASRIMSAQDVQGGVDLADPEERDRTVRVAVSGDPRSWQDWTERDRSTGEDSPNFTDISLVSDPTDPMALFRSEYQNEPAPPRYSDSRRYLLQCIGCGFTREFDMGAFNLSAAGITCSRCNSIVDIIRMA